MSPRTLTDLPNEPLLQISSYFDQQDPDTPLKNLASVSRRLRELLASQLFRSLYFVGPNPLCDVDPIAMHAQRLTLELHGAETANDYSAICLPLQGLPNLVELTLDIGAAHISGLQNATPAAFTLQRLKSLRVSCRATSFVAFCTNVCTLHICGCFAGRECACQLAPANSVTRLSITGALRLERMAVAYLNVEHLVHREYYPSNIEYSDRAKRVVHYSTGFAARFGRLESVEWVQEHFRIWRAASRAVVERSGNEGRRERWEAWKWLEVA
jgi:hypothetical protein